MWHREGEISLEEQTLGGGLVGLCREHGYCGWPAAESRAHALPWVYLGKCQPSAFSPVEWR